MKMNKSTVTMNAKKITTPSWMEEIRKFSKMFYHDDDDDDDDTVIGRFRFSHEGG